MLTKTFKLKGHKFPVSEKVLKSMQTVKQTYREWASAGTPRSGKLFYENKMANKSVFNPNNLQRSEEVVRRKSFYDNLMQNPSSDKVYKLKKEK